jgi:hypothetical protein
MFVYKNTAELEALTQTELDQYKTELKAHEAEQLKTTVNETVKLAIEKAKEDLKDFLGQEVAGQLAEKTTEQIVDVRKSVADFLVKNADKIKEVYKSGHGLVEIQLKDVGSISTASGTNVSPPAITGTQQAPLQNVNLRNFDVTALTTNVNTRLSAYPYTEAKPKDGDYGFVAEGTAKPQSDFEWETNYAKPVKIATWVRLTEESIQDVVGLESVVYDLLAKKHQIKKSKGLLYGDGISPNPKGATEYGRAFVAGDMAGAVINPNFMDVVNACITDIATTHNYEDEMPYMANIVLVNPIDFYIQLVSAKDENGLPLYPNASLFNVVNIGGVSIYPEETIPAGKIFVCDMSKYNTTNYVPYNVRIGWINDDQIKNQFLIIAESRFHAFVKKLDEQAFIYDDIATIKTAITFEELAPSV